MGATQCASCVKEDKVAAATEEAGDSIVQQVPISFCHNDYKGAPVQNLLEDKPEEPEPSQNTTPEIQKKVEPEPDQEVVAEPAPEESHAH
jgi:hypothetical protein